MALLARFQILTKIIAVVVLLSALAAGITWLGVHSLSSLNNGATE
jgi:methyl-accepting chemotaxis protein